MKFNSLGQREASLYHDTLDFAGITDTASYPLIQFCRSANYWYRKADSWIWQATGTWEFDDSNYTDFPIATTTLVANQQDYEIPSAARKIDRIEVLDDVGDYHLIKPFDKSQIKGASMSEFMEEAGFPNYYDLVGNSVLLYPKPSASDVTTSAGLKLYFSRDINAFAVTDTATEPGFDNHFHRIISLGSSYDYCMSNGVEDRKVNLRNELEVLRSELQEFFGARHRDMKPKIIPKVSSEF